MKKHSATNESQPEPRPILFLDRSIDVNILAENLRLAGANIKRHRDEFKDDEEDAIWLPIVGQHNWIVITKDERIRYNPLEIQALQRASVGMFLFVPKKLTASEISDVIITALPEIEHAARSTSRPFIIKIHRDGSLKLVSLGNNFTK